MLYTCEKFDKRKLGRFQKCLKRLKLAFYVEKSTLSPNRGKDLVSKGGLNFEIN